MFVGPKSQEKICSDIQKILQGAAGLKVVGRSWLCQDVGMRKPSGMRLGEQLLLEPWQEPPHKLPGSK